MRAAEILDRLPNVFQDDAGRVVGFMGLSVAAMGDHRLHLAGRALSTWCAWDTLFLPELLGAEVRVTSRCPVTREAISMRADRAGVTDLSPASTVVSFLVPEAGLDADVIRTFCHYVHFFATREAGRTWTAARAGTVLIGVQDAYRLSQLTNAGLFGSRESVA